MTHWICSNRHFLGSLRKRCFLFTTNKISKWFSGIGQEAISVGVTKACSNEDFLLPMHRNLVFQLESPYTPFCQLLAADGFSLGRERSFPFGSLEHRIVGMISYLAAMMPVADGAQLSQITRKESIAVSFVGMEPQVKVIS